MRMSLDDEMTALMNVVRSKYAITDKLSIADATEYISKPEISSVLDGNSSFLANNADSTTTNGVFRMASTSDDTKGITGAYTPYDKSNIIPGKRYRFTTLIHGNMNLWQIGEEANPTSGLNIQLTNDWQLLSFDFQAVRDIIIYAKSKKDDWMELKNWCFSEVGGVAWPDLFANREPINSLEHNDGTYSAKFTGYLEVVSLYGFSKFDPNKQYALDYAVKGSGIVSSYFYGNNSKGNYIENEIDTQLSSQWVHITKFYTGDNVPINGRFYLRNNAGPIDITFTMPHLYEIS